MTQQQFLEEIKQLSVAERIELIETIKLTLREDIEPEKDNGPDKRTLSQRLRGVIKFDGAPPTDKEVKEMYADYLSEKYS